jgi:selenide, water dikinase
MNPQVKKDIVLVGGGHSHVAVLKAFGMKPQPGVRLTLITRDIHTPYSGMLPGLIAGHYSYDEAHVDLRPLANFAQARIYHDSVIGFDFEQKYVLCKNRPPVAYDVLSINSGSTPNRHEIPGVEEHSIPVKPIDGFLVRWDALRSEILSAPTTPRNIVVVGAGAGGVELLLSVQHHLKQEAEAKGQDFSRLSFRLISGSSEILPTHNVRVQAKFRRVLQERGVDVITSEKVTSVGSKNMMCESGRIIKADAVFWVTHGVAANWLSETGLDVDERGCVLTNQYLQTLKHSDVFAAGDNATSTTDPRPKSGVFAVRAGPVLAENLRRRARSLRLKAWRPQKAFLSLISTGDAYAIGSRGPFAFEGAKVWSLKDWIDRRWMAKYHELPEMSEMPPPPVEKPAAGQGGKMVMRCAGCGSKIGSSILHRALKGVTSVDHKEIIKGFNQPDDAAIIELPAGKLSIETVDFFRSFINDSYLFTKIAVNHCLSDVFAMGAQAHHALAIVTVPYGSDSKIENELREVLTGATEMMNEAGCALVGGHTNEGPELIFGLSVTGYTSREDVFNKGGCQPGQVLLLTKPLGTGTLLAADMQLKAKGRWIESAMDMMLTSNRVAAEILHTYKASSCTDVTGFGLMGHLLEMVKQSDVNITLELREMPVLPGAIETCEMGILSTLHPSNLEADSFISNRTDAEAHEKYPLLFDPQTSGGLLASIPLESFARCLKDLHEAGYKDARVIGQVRPKTDLVYPITLSL